MGFKIAAAGDGYRVILSGEPNWVIGLWSGAGPADLGDGACLVVAFSLWSTPDRVAAYRGVAVAKTREFSGHVYLLPYDCPKELKAWLPRDAERPGTVISQPLAKQGSVTLVISQNERASPLWFSVQNRGVVEFRQGPIQDDEIAILLSSLRSEGSRIDHAIQKMEGDVDATGHNSPMHPEQRDGDC